MHDVVIIGAGPAGLTAALYALRADRTVLLLEAGGFGGQVTHSPKIENYPGFEQISGNELTDRLVGQALAQGAEVEMTRATGITRKEALFTITTEDGDFEAKAVIIATGAKHRTLGLEGEGELEGISYCAVCDGAFYKGQRVAVIGGGNSALQEATLLADSCEHVTVIQNLAFLTGEARLADKLRQRDNVDFIYSTVVTGLNSQSGSLTGLRLHNGETGKDTSLSVDGMFVCIGLAPENGDFAALAPLDKYGYIEANESCATPTPGLFVAGDCRTKDVRQITTAVGDAATAAIAAIRYCDSL